jgi:uncharacterized membrane protein
LVLRGTFAGHYLDIDEALHVSQRGAAEGFVGGGVVGVLLGPLGIAVGTVLGAIVGSQVGTSSETDPEPQLLVDRLRAAVPRSSSAIVMIASAPDVHEMLAVIGESGGAVVRQTLTAEQTVALRASLGESAAASSGSSG